MKKRFQEGSELDGYDNLRPEDQAKIIKAWQDGRIPDEDIPEGARKPARADGSEDDEEKPKKSKRAPAKKKADIERPQAKRKTVAANLKVRSFRNLNDCTVLLIMGMYLQKTDDDSEDDEEEEELEEDSVEDQEKSKKKRKLSPRKEK